MCAHIIENDNDIDVESCVFCDTVTMGSQGRVPSEVTFFRCAEDHARPVSPLQMDSDRTMIPTDDDDDDANDTDKKQTTTLRYLNETQSFLLLVKLTMLYLTHSQQVHLRWQVRVLVNHCTAQNRLHNPLYRPLRPVLHTKLRQVLGDDSWKHIQHLLLSYCHSRHLVLPEEY
jgi:hypothetical protein